MKLIVGLGNPGSEYEKTRHNAGFLVVDALATQFHLSFRSKRAINAELAEGEINGKRVLLCKPQTFMNSSGRSVQAIMNKYPVHVEDIIVVYDDADLPFGEVRYKGGGGSAGQKGMASILELFPAGTNLARVRFGIGRPSHTDIPLDEFVLQAWNASEKEVLDQHIQEAISHVLTYV